MTKINISLIIWYIACLESTFMIDSQDYAKKDYTEKYSYECTMNAIPSHPVIVFFLFMNF